MDIVQESILKAMTRLSSLRNPDYMKTWFYRIVINESLNYLRKHKRDFIQEDLSFLPAREENVSGAVDVYRAIEKLDPKLRTIIMLRFYKDMKLEEIAHTTHTNVNTVKSRLYKALDQLKPWIGE